MNHLELMRVFKRVAELASFTQAADQLGMPKASISTAVRQLEQELGTRLLQRTTRTVQMTPDGKAYYERCSDLLADVDDVQGMFRASDVALSGRLRVDMPVSLARNRVMPRLPEFIAAHPLLEIEFSSTDRRVDVIREGFDCVIRVGSLAESSLVARPLGEFTMANCVSPAYLQRFGMPGHVDQLDQHRLVHYAPTFGAGPGSFEYVEEGVTRQRVMPVALTVNNADAYQSACLAGLGIIQAPAKGLADLLASGALVEVLPDARAAPMPVSLLYPARRHLPRRTQLFMNWVADILQEI